MAFSAAWPGCKRVLYPLSRLKTGLEVISLLEIKDLSVSVGGKQVLNGVNLRVNKGETHALFGPNGTGKTTLLNAISGIPRYVVDGGSIIFKARI
jgi:Fe-S cluster assembly ATP-binding protein